MSVTSHLKDLLTKMGGTPKNGDSTSVLIDKIEDVYNGSGGGSSGGVSSYNDLTDRPFDVTKDYITLFEETVTVEERSGAYGAQLAYTGGLDEDIIKVTFDGTEYICEKYTPDGFPEGSWFYGGIYSENGAAAEEDRLDFSEYPFIIGLGTIITEMPGTHTVKVMINSEDISTTEDFEKAVKSINSSGSSDTLLGAIFPIKLTCEKISDTVLTVSGGKTGPTEENFILANLKLDKTANEIYNAICSGSKILLYFDGPVFNNSFYRSNLSIMMNSLPIMIPKVNISTLLNYYDGTDAQVPFSLATEQFIQQYLATPFDAEHRADIRDKYVSNIEINKFVVDGMVPSMGVSVEEAAHNPSIPSNIILNDDTIDILFLIGDQPLNFMSNGIDDYPVSIIPLPCTV